MLRVNFQKQLWHFELKVNFEVDAGQVLVLWGQSGAGKTTVLECISGLRQPDQGIIELKKRLLFSSDKGVNLPAKQRQIGYMFQDYALFPHMTVKDNINFGFRYQDDQMSLSPVWFMELIEVFGIKHLLNRYPYQLSGGEQQRTALARALAIKPRLLLLDEPFSALDHKIRIDLQFELKKVKQHWNIPIILVTHDKNDEKMLGDSIINIDYGQMCS